MNKKFKLLMLLPLGVTSLLGTIRNESPISVGAADVHYDYVVSSSEEFKTVMDAYLAASGTFDKNIKLEADVEYTPVQVTSKAKFTGILEGNNKKITYIGSTPQSTGSKGRMSLFFQVSGTVRNLTTDGEIYGHNRVAPICVELSTGGLIENCTNYTDITGVEHTSTNAGDYFGGFVAIVNSANITSSYSTISNCVNYGTITSQNVYNMKTAEDTAPDSFDATLGGIAGFTFPKSKIINCVNNGEIITYGSRSGGIVGRISTNIADEDSSIIIQNCTNNADLTFKTTTAENTLSSTQALLGGITSTAQPYVKVLNCINNGNVISETKDYVGGIVAYSHPNALIENCINNGNVSTKGMCVGGISGYSINSLIQNCINNGDISSTSKNESYAGGIVGDARDSLTINFCDNYGTISSPGYGNGGIAGAAYPYKTKTIHITNCYNGGEINASRYNGSIVGHVAGKTDSSAKIVYTNCVAGGNVIGYGSGYVGKFCGNAKSADNFELINCVTLNTYEYAKTSNVEEFMGSVAIEPSASTIYALAEGVSENVLTYIEAVRKHNCENTEATQQTLLATKLSAEEQTLLSTLLCYAEGYDGNANYHSYIEDANYILSLHTNTQLGLILDQNIINQLPIYTVVIVCGICLVTYLVFIKKRNTKQN